MIVGHRSGSGLVASLLLLASCVSNPQVTYGVVTTPPGALIEVNGQRVGVAPCDIKLKKVGRWVGIAFGGFDYSGTPTYEVLAIPPNDWKGEQLYVQRRLINPARDSEKGVQKLELDLRHAGANN
jgi:hypothetical protein